MMWRIRAAAVVSTLILVPLAIAPNLCFSIDVSPKVIALLFSVGIALLLCSNLGSQCYTVFCDPSLRIFAIALLLPLVAAGVCTAFSLDATLSFEGTSWRRLGLIELLVITVYAFLLLVLVRTLPRLMDILLLVCVGVGLVAAIYGIAQATGYDPLLPQRYYVSYGVVRPPSTFGHSLYFASFLVMIVLIAMDLFLASESRLRRLLGFCGTTIGLAAILASGARSALFGVIIGGIWAFSWNYGTINRKSLLKLVIGILAVCACIGVTDRRALISRAQQWRTDPMGSIRLLLWRDTLSMAVSRPLVGTGIETFELAFPKAESIRLARDFPNHLHESPHNVFLDILASEGVLGLICMLWFWGAVLWLCFTRGRDKPHVGALTAALVGSIVAHQFHCYVIPTYLYTYIIAVLGISYCLNDRVLESRAIRYPFVWTASAVAVAILCICASSSLGILELNLQRVQNEFINGSPADALDLYQNTVEASYWCCYTDLWMSLNLLDVATHEKDNRKATSYLTEAAAMSQRAARHSTDPALGYYQLARAWAQLGEPQRLEDALRCSIAAAPTWFEPHLALARLLTLENRPEEARVELGIAKDLYNGSSAF